MTPEEDLRPVIKISGLKHFAINVTMIYNVFSNFGNIYKMIFHKPNQTVIVEYETKFYATFAKEYLNGVFFMGSQM
jgi:hypothetical protein